MRRSFTQYLAGRVRFEVIGGRGERFLNACTEKGVAIEQIAPTPTGFFVSVPLRDYRPLHKLARANRCRLRVTEKHGAYFALAVYRKRYGILIGLALCIALMLLSQSLVWKIDFFDFTPAEEARLRESLYERQIYEGSKVTQEQLDRAEKEIFIEKSDYGWLTLNWINGRIEVEKTNATPKPAMFGSDITDLVAAQDGTITAIDVSGGFLQRSIGQFVAQGDILVRGMEWDSVGNPMYVHSEGRIYATVTKKYVYAQPLRITNRVPCGESKSYYELYLPGGLTVPLYRSIETPPDAIQTVVRYPWTPFGFSMPVTIKETRVRPTQEIAQVLTPQQAQDVARVHLFDTIENDLKDYKLLSKEEFVVETEDSIQLTMEIVANANIAEMAPYTPVDPPKDLLQNVP